MIYEHQEAAEEGLEAACRCQQQAWKPELLSNRQPERFSYDLDTKHEEEAMNAKHAIPIGTPVMANTHTGYTATGVVCDHETVSNEAGERTLLYHIAMDWPRGVRVINARDVKELGTGRQW